MTQNDGKADGDDPGNAGVLSEGAIVNLLENCKLLDNDEVRRVVDLEFAMGNKGREGVFAHRTFFRGNP